MVLIKNVKKIFIISFYFLSIIFYNVTLAQNLSYETKNALKKFEILVSRRSSEDRSFLINLSPIIIAQNITLNPSNKGLLLNELQSSLLKFPNIQVRVCTSCMETKIFQKKNATEYVNSVTSLDEITAFDKIIRKEAKEAVSALFVEEIIDGLSIKIISLINGQVIFATNLTTDYKDEILYGYNYSLIDDYERKIAGKAIVHLFMSIGYEFMPDYALYSSMAFPEQLGATNQHLFGPELSFGASNFGIGAFYGYIYSRKRPLILGTSVFLNVIAALGSSNSEDFSLSDLLIVRGHFLYPMSDRFGNIALFGYANIGKGSLGFGIGVSLINLSFW